MNSAASQPTPRIPHHRAIAAEIEGRISSGQYPRGTLLKSETELAAEFGVSRMTLRHALSGLAAAGIIERRHGHGTLVADARFTRRAQRGFVLSDELAAHGFSPGSHVLEVGQIAPHEEARVVLRLGSHARVTRVLRQRFANNTLIGYQETVIPSKFCPGLAASDLEGTSLTKVIFDRYRLRATEAELTVDAVEADDRLASLLEVDAASALLRIVRVSYLPDGRPLERTTGWYPGNRFVVRLNQSLDTVNLIPRLPDPTT
jgi:GntR family transcriptional regulator